MSTAAGFGNKGIKHTLVIWTIATKNLHSLKPTNIVSGRENVSWLMGNVKNRGKKRSVTYMGIARAMAEQWSDTSVLH